MLDRQIRWIAFVCITYIPFKISAAQQLINLADKDSNGTKTQDSNNFGYVFMIHQYFEAFGLLSNIAESF